MIKANKAPHILVVDDDSSMRVLLEMIFSKRGYKVSDAQNGRTAISMLRKKQYDLLLCDIRLGDISGIEVLKAAKNNNHNTVVIMISGFATTEAAIEAMNEGAYDYVPKPFDVNELQRTVSRALELRGHDDEKSMLDEELQQHLHFGNIVGNSPAMHNIYRMIKQVAKTKTSVLITGESGTGKELVARSLHKQSDRSDKPFVVINCGGIPPTLMESEMFGHKKGAFTGALYDKKGLFEIADGGTVFFDEMSEFTLPLQVQLLRVVQEKVFKPVGDTKDIHVDIRIISATNKNLEDEVIAGNFREDLFYRINVVNLKLPPLRERKSDLRALAQYFLDKYSREMGKDIGKISSYAIDLLSKYDFPGNVRELENLIERSVAISTTNIILPESLSLSMHKRRWIEGVKGRRFDLDEVATGVNLDEIMEAIESAYLKKALDFSNWNISRAADLLGISLRSMRYRISKLSIKQSNI